MIILDGEKLSRKILSDLKKEIELNQLKLKLAVFYIGESRVSKSYLDKKREACAKTGIDFQLNDFSSDVLEDEFKKRIKEAVKDKAVSGIVVQLPLLKKFNTQEILDLLPANKDIDVLSKVSFERFSKNELSIMPPVVKGIKRLFEEYDISLSGKKVVLIGKGRLVGKPLSVWLESEGADFLVLDKETKDLSVFTKDADILISGTGSAGIVKKDMIKEGAILVDAGTSSEDGVIKGDIDKDAYEKAGYVAPVPGGVGPMTIACLIDNLVRLNK